MENLILWGAPAIGVLVGFNYRFFRSYVGFLNILFAVYLAIWSESLIGSFYRLPEEAMPYHAAVTILISAVIIWVILLKITDQLIPDNKAFEFPPLIDKFGGAVCGFLIGAILISFISFLFCITPQKARAEEMLSLAALEQSTMQNLLLVTQGVDVLSYQYQQFPMEQRHEKLEKLIRLADPPPPEAEEEDQENAEGQKNNGTPDANQPAPSRSR